MAFLVARRRRYGVAATSRASSGRGSGWSADSFATSIRLHLDRDAVRMDKVREPTLQPFEWGDDMDFAGISDTGVIGDPTQASAEAGARIWELCVRGGVRLTSLLLDGHSDQVRQTWHFLP